MSNPICMYLSLSFEEYKWMEAQMKEFVETIHTSTGGFYHKSVRLELGFDRLTLEFHGPLVKAAEEPPFVSEPSGESGGEKATADALDEHEE